MASDGMQWHRFFGQYKAQKILMFKLPLVHYYLFKVDRTFLDKIINMKA